MDQVLTNFDSAKDDELSGIAAAIIAGCTDNADFSVVAQLAAVVTYTTVYNGALAACDHGDEAKQLQKIKRRVYCLFH